jgi:membrane-bound serine protease (ClpP class)
VLVPVLVVTVGFFGFAVFMALRAQRRRVVSGSEGLVGLTAEVRRALDPEGAVFVAGEHWTAVVEGGGRVPVGGRVTVVGVDHLRLTVRPERTEEP